MRTQLIVLVRFGPGDRFLTNMGALRKARPLRCKTFAPSGDVVEGDRGHKDHRTSICEGEEATARDLQKL